MAEVYKHVVLARSLLQQAQAEAQIIGSYSGSHRKREGTIVGCIGELVAAAWLRDNRLASKRTNTIEHDMVIASKSSQGVRIEVKTKDRTVIPRPEYEATVPIYVYEKQRPDYYIFVSLLRPKGAPMHFTDAYIVGGLDRTSFDRLKMKQGTGRKPNGAMFFTEAWNVYLRDLREPQDLIVELQARSI